MKNILTVGSHKAIISYDEDINLLRGEILGLTGSADFYTDNVSKLKDEFETSLKVYLDTCEKHNINPYTDNTYIKQEDIETACGAGVLFEVLDYIENK